MADCCGGRRGRMLLSGGESGSEGKAVVAFGRSHSAENEQEEFTTVILTSGRRPHCQHGIYRSYPGAFRGDDSETIL